MIKLSPMEDETVGFVVRVRVRVEADYTSLFPAETLASVVTGVAFSSSRAECLAGRRGSSEDDTFLPKARVEQGESSANNPENADNRFPPADNP